MKADLEFKKILDDGKKIAGAYSLIFTAPDKELKLGVITSKKLGNAVIRNRIKRRIKEAFSILDKEKPIQYKIVVIPRKITLCIGFEKLKSQFEEMLKKA